MPVSRLLKPALIAIGALAFLSACNENGQNAAKGPPAMPPTPVSVTSVQPEDLPITNELPGRIAPTRIAEVRPRVSGIVIERVFEQGSFVKEGDVLYRIDPAPFKVEVDRAKATLARKYPHVQFLGALSGEALTRAYAGADVFVFPSRTDTFGLVTLEALACGLTVAAYPVEGPRDVVGPEVPGGADVAVLDQDLRKACLEALALRQNPRAVTPRAFAEGRSWRSCTLQFLGNIAVEPDED